MTDADTPRVPEKKETVMPERHEITSVADIERLFGVSAGSIAVVNGEPVEKGNDDD